MTLMNEFRKLVTEDKKNAEEYRRKSLGLEDFNLSTEMIEHQIDDPFVKHCAACFQELIALTVKRPETPTTKLVKNSAVKAVLDRIDMLVKDRFGLPIKHLGSDETAYACFPVAPNKNTVLDVVTQWDNLTKHYGNKEPSKRVEDETELTENSIIRIVKSAKALEKQINSKGVTIDLKKAYVSGLPTDYTLYVLVNLNCLIAELGLTALQLVAILTHELGHLFTHLEYSYKVIAKTNVLIETVVENAVKKGKSAKDTLLLIAPHVLPDNQVKNLANKSTPIIAVAVTRGVLALTKQPHWYTDSEQLADQFAGRLGLSKELVTALEVFREYINDTKRTIFIFCVIPSVLLSVECIGCLLLTGAPIFIFMSLLIVPYMLMVIFMYLSYGEDDVSDIEHGMTYDNLKQRYNRIKLEMIRRLRSCDLPKNDIATLIANIEMVDNIIKNTPEPEIGIMEKIKRFFSSERMDLVESKEFEQLVEMMMENDLHLATAKIKTLI